MSSVDLRTKLNVQVKFFDDRYKNGEWGITPKTEGSAGIDLHAALSEPVTIAPGETVLIKSGLAVYLEHPSFVGMIYPRSGLGTKEGIVLGNLTGVIDSDFQGEMGIPVWNRNFDKSVTINPGDRIAQYVVLLSATIVPSVVDDFTNRTLRGEGGFGHSGVNG